MSQRRIVRAYATSLLGVGSGLVTSLWVLREVSSQVGPDAFGAYAYAVQLVAYLAILQIGLDFAAARKIAAALATSDFAEARRAFLTVRRFNWVVAAAAAVAVMLLALFLDSARWHLDQTVLRMLVVLLGVGQICNFLARPSVAALVGGGFQAWSNSIIVFTTLAISCSALVLLHFGWGVLSVPIGTAALTALSAVVTWGLAKHLCGWLRINSVGPTRVDRAVFRFGALSALGGLAWTVEATSDVAIIGALGTPADVGVYVLWWRFPSMLFDVCARLANSAFPSFAEQHAVSLPDAVKGLEKVGWVTLSLATLCLIGVGAWLPAFVRLWLDGRYLGPEAASWAWAMGLLVSLRVVGNLLGMFWLAGGRARFTTALNWVQALVKVSIGVELYTSHGVLGLLIASSISAGLQVIGLAVFLLRKRALPVTFVLHAVLLFSGAAIVVYLIGFAPQPGDIVAFASSAGLTAVSWGAVCLLTWWLTTRRLFPRVELTAPGSRAQGPHV